MRLISMIALTATLALAGTTARAAEADAPGRAVYLRYCGACHGPGGHGDGIAGTFDPGEVANDDSRCWLKRFS